MASLKIQCNVDMKQDVKIRIQKTDITEDHVLLGVLSLGAVWAYG